MKDRGVECRGAEVPLLTFDEWGNPLMDGKSLGENASSIRLTKGPNVDRAVLSVDYLVRVDTKKP